MASSRATIFLDTFRAELARSKRVLTACPAGSEELRPHPESPTARDGAGRLPSGQGLMVKALTTGFDWSKPSGSPPKPPESLAEIAAELDSGLELVANALQGVNDEALNETVTFPVGPKKFGEFRKIDFLWFLLHDHIHHRGQLSVYVRLAGGKVPAIYGPSGDEPWF